MTDTRTIRASWLAGIELSTLLELDLELELLCRCHSNSGDDVWHDFAWTMQRRDHEGRRLLAAGAP
ncbi:MAG TPA: hypothetical protein VH442_18980 [Micromonosporaceae bacterium]|jgi:hypothetical protein